MPQVDFVDVEFVLSPSGAPRPSFGLSLILQNLTDAQDALMVARTALVTAAGWPAELAALGITAGEPTYTEVQSLFSQTISPAKGYIGRRGKGIQQVWTIQVPAVPADGVYAINVATGVGTPYSFIAATSTQAAVRTALLAALAAGSALFTAAAAVAPGAITLTAVAAGVPGLTVTLQSPASSMTGAVTTGTSVLTVAQVWEMTIVTAALGVYTLTVGTTTGQNVYTHIATTGATLTTIRDALKSLYDATPSDLFGVTMTTSGGNKGVLTASVSGRPGTVSITSPASDATTVVTTANYGIADDWAVMIAAQPDFYEGLLNYATDQELLLSGEFFEAEKRHLLGMQTSDADILTSVTTDVFSKLKAKLYLRSFGVQHPTNSEGVCAAWSGNVLTSPAGQVNWKARALTGLTGRILTAPEAANLLSKEGSFLELFAARDQSVMDGAYSFAGRPIDITRAIDTFRTNVEIALMDLLVNARIVPYSKVGQSMVSGAIWGEINRAVAQGYAIDGTFSVEFPPISSASANDRKRGIMPTFVVNGTIQAGTYTIRVRGSLAQ